MLGSASRATTFRNLKHVPYMRSYNHNGNYYTFRDPTHFDCWGLYGQGNILLSREGKLGNTVKRLVRESQMGVTRRELQDLLQVYVQVLLLEAVRHDEIRRDLFDGLYLYLHNDSEIGETQLKKRHGQITNHRCAPDFDPGQPERYDYEYVRHGFCNIFIACEPLSGKRMVTITERTTKRDWAVFLEEIAEKYQEAEKITLVMDNLNTHQPGSLYESFPPVKAKIWYVVHPVLA